MQLSKDQSKQFEEFISKIPISKVRSDIERIWDAVKHAGYSIKTEELDALNTHAIHLPADLQTYPQTFSHWVKNEDHTVADEKAQKTSKKVKANLGDEAASVQEGVKVVDKDTNDTSVSPFDDSDNKEAPKQTKAKDEKRKELTKEAQAGDLHRSTEAMSKKATQKKDTKKATRVVVVPKKRAVKKEK